MELYSYEKEHISSLRDLAPECMVLLKSDGNFPICEPGKVALYGSGARNTIKGGTGSGDVNVRRYVTIEEGLKNAGFTITTKEWLDCYDETYKEARISFVQSIKDKAREKGVPAIMLGMGAVMPEPNYELPLEENGELAIYVLARISGEGADRKEIPGDFALTETEIRDILFLEKSHKKFLLVLNVGGVVDITPVKQVANILLLSQVGMTIGDSFADVLLGKSYPSGKLSSTWASWKDYCSIGDFGEQDDTRYKEGIYVGYRYFDTVKKEPIFPFGYGLGYTTFDLGKPIISVEGTKVSLMVGVKNTGSVAGKEIVQLYVSIPSHKLDQPYQTLAAFAKTEELHSKEEQNVLLTFSLEDLASFEEKSASEVLEPGDYVLRCGNSSRNTQVCGIIRLESEIIVKRLEHVGGTTDFMDWIPDAGAGNYSSEDYIDVSIHTVKAKDFVSESINSKPNVSSEVMELIHSLSESELAYVCVGGFKDKGSDSVIGNAGMTVAGAAGETTHRLLERSVQALVMADGPAGLRLNKQYGVDEKGVFAIGNLVPAAMIEFMDDALRAAFGIQDQSIPERKGEIHDQYCSALPIGTAVAQSWNIDLCQKLGDMVGEEMERFGVHLWLAPALNIHRSPLCGRNFEYYSEDPLISGRMATGITKGVQKHSGCGVTIKHYVCNNQETNRFHSNSIVSERALRDIYMKGFKIVVKEASPHALMTSYNLLNGEHTSHRRDINVTVLRKEWGFEGMVMSDWVTPGLAPGVHFKYPYACASGSIKGGNDIMMPGTVMDYQDLMNALEDVDHEYHITRENLEECAAHIVQLALKLGKKKIK